MTVLKMKIKFQYKKLMLKEYLYINIKDQIQKVKNDLNSVPKD